MGKRNCVIHLKFYFWKVVGSNLNFLKSSTYHAIVPLIL